VDKVIPSEGIGRDSADGYPPLPRIAMYIRPSSRQSHRENFAVVIFTYFRISLTDIDVNWNSPFVCFWNITYLCSSYSARTCFPVVLSRPYDTGYHFFFSMRKGNCFVATRRVSNKLGLSRSLSEHDEIRPCNLYTILPSFRVLQRTIIGRGGASRRTEMLGLQTFSLQPEVRMDIHTCCFR
jgi:hypothetical protein